MLTMILFIVGTILVVEVTNFAFNRVLRRDLKKINEQLETRIKASERIRRNAGTVSKT